MSSAEARLRRVHADLKACRLCPAMCGSAVHGPALETRIMLVGQAPGLHEETLGRPFAYTAGKTLFKWLNQATGLTEDEARALIYFSAVARCFPGKNPKGAGDRPPHPEELKACRPHLEAEFAALQPRLVLAVGRFAIAALLEEDRALAKAPLTDLVGRKFRARFAAVEVDVIPLPHPSGVSRWPHSADGKKKLAQALRLIGREFSKYCG